MSLKIVDLEGNNLCETGIGCSAIIRLLLKGFCLLVVVTLCVLYVCDRRYSVGWYAKKIQPYDSRENVEKIIPKRFGAPEYKRINDFQTGTRIVAPDTKCEYEWRIGAYWLLAIESLIIYFDADDRVVGLYYSTSGGPWSEPKWGEKHVRECNAQTD